MTTKGICPKNKDTISKRNSGFKRAVVTEAGIGLKKYGVLKQLIEAVK